MSASAHAPTPPPLSDDEGARLAALRSYQILDTAPEERFDRITRTVQTALGVPIALISFLDRERQWFKSCVGLGLSETKREVAFCAYNTSSDLMEVEDATEDDRFAKNPLVTGPPGIRFYAGAPIFDPEGRRLGSLCAIDTEPRRLRESERDVLRDLAGVVTDELELRALTEGVAEQARRDRDMARASEQAREADREALAEILTEDLRQVLEAMRLTLDRVASEAKPPAAEEKSERQEGSRGERQPPTPGLAKVQGRLREATRLVGELSSQYAPPVGAQPLQETLAWTAGRFEDAYGLSVSVEGRGEAVGPRRDAEALRGLVYQLVRGVLHGAARQVDPSREASAEVVERDGQVDIVLTGGQLSVEALMEEPGVEIAREELEARGGSVEADLQPGEREVRVALTIPPEDPS